MSSLPAPFISKLGHELAAVKAETASLEALVSVGAASLGPEGLVDAQKLDHILQSLDCLTSLMTNLAQGMPLEQAVNALPLADMAERLSAGHTGHAIGSVHFSTTLVDPELF
ncbi:hypothetical protein [Aquidulcibacter sp.]|uniref:hypothetical protein n=1 Tax=Aquidulcibacter sp. TaxID=2052990 RepID=UPI0025B8D79E|nr:hypothetical protein [Aquidulcibacter sp.]MCA3693492.1 hypothetical protein [Aquidulcibacter sp.]